jgi:hypothetical protein
LREGTVLEGVNTLAGLAGVKNRLLTGRSPKERDRG